MHQTRVESRTHSRKVMAGFKFLISVVPPKVLNEARPSKLEPREKLRNFFISTLPVALYTLFWFFEMLT